MSIKIFLFGRAAAPLRRQKRRGASRRRVLRGLSVQSCPKGSFAPALRAAPLRPLTRARPAVVL